jgi:hypothetical protein
VRRGNWTYIDDRGPYLRFDLQADPGERHDVAQRHADLVRELRSLVARWEADVDAESKERTPARQRHGRIDGSQHRRVVDRSYASLSGTT